MSVSMAHSNIPESANKACNSV